MTTERFDNALVCASTQPTYRPGGGTDGHEGGANVVGTLERDVTGHRCGNWRRKRTALAGSSAVYGHQIGEIESTLQRNFWSTHMHMTRLDRAVELSAGRHTTKIAYKLRWCKVYKGKTGVSSPLSKQT